MTRCTCCEQNRRAKASSSSSDGSGMVGCRKSGGESGQCVDIDLWQTARTRMRKRCPVQAPPCSLSPHAEPLSPFFCRRLSGPGCGAGAVRRPGRRLLGNQDTERVRGLGGGCGSARSRPVRGTSAAGGGDLERLVRETRDETRRDAALGLREVRRRSCPCLRLRLRQKLRA